MPLPWADVIIHVVQQARTPYTQLRSLDNSSESPSTTLVQVGGLLDSKGYGIATLPGTPYKELLDNAILKLKEDGELHKLNIRHGIHK